MKVRVDLLWALVRGLRAFKPNGLIFHMGEWWLDLSQAFRTYIHSPSVQKIKEERDCGTVCCAAGLASTLPEFQKEGFIVVEGSNLVQWTDPGGRECLSFHAISSLLISDSSDDVPIKDRARVEVLFDPTHYSEAERTDPLAVADRIEAFINSLPNEEIR